MDTPHETSGAVRRHPRTALTLLAAALALVAYESLAPHEDSEAERWALERREPVRVRARRRPVMVDYSRPRNAEPEPEKAEAPPDAAAPAEGPGVKVDAPAAPSGSAPPAVPREPAPESAPGSTPEPASPESAPPRDPATFRLTRIVYDPGDPDARFAVIDGRAVRAGETIGGWTVGEVLPDRVRLEGPGEVVITPGGKEER